MTPRREPPPEHVCSAFGGRAADVEPLPGSDTAWRCDSVVLRRVTDRARALWTARTLDSVNVPDLRIAKPVRSTDGRWIVAGWSANRYLSGTPEHRPDEVVLAAVKLHQATAEVAAPDFLTGRTDVYARADRIAWDHDEVDLDENRGGRWFEVLAGARRPVAQPSQVVHGDLFGTVLFDGDAPPGIVDFPPFHRPAEWGAAIAAVDAVTWGGADAGLLARWAHLPEWPQMLLRAMLYRLAVNALDPRSTPAALDALRATAREVSALL
ncbi:TIGR02569 family protein [Amycolatopsis suaedae]|uniref:TIGR02569 family protein n=1 Tax=Amycolatopsis suaedae TaxID=2510978 RepID=A0A4Q7J4Y1_9PSEU|nr:TIGR02569 family protein [Amycolatopsis suaedae]RZQ62630.1 TIGR02569 family protein [Amycolatopsis suaedae]